MWDQRYSEAEFAFGTEPNDFLAEELHHFPDHGRVLCLAEGEGRNAVYLARHGFEVTAIDQSSVGMDKAQHLAKDQGVKIETVVMDLTDYKLEANSWDAIVSIYAHVPPETRKRLHKEAVKALRPGGVFLLEAYTPRQLDMPGIGGPPAHMKELFMEEEVLKEELEGLDIFHHEELDREVNEGDFHEGLGAVVQIIARAGKY